MSELHIILIILAGCFALIAGTFGVTWRVATSRAISSLRPPAKEAPSMTDSQRLEMPWVLRETCDVRHEALDRELDGITTNLARANTNIGEALDGVANLRGALGSAGVRRGGSAQR